MRLLTLATTSQLPPFALRLLDAGLHAAEVDCVALVFSVDVQRLKFGDVGGNGADVRVQNSGALNGSERNPLRPPVQAAPSAPLASDKSFPTHDGVPTTGHRTLSS